MVEDWQWVTVEGYYKGGKTIDGYEEIYLDYETASEFCHDYASNEDDAEYVAVSDRFEFVKDGCSIECPYCKTVDGVKLYDFSQREWHWVDTDGDAQI